MGAQHRTDSCRRSAAIVRRGDLVHLHHLRRTSAFQSEGHAEGRECAQIVEGSSWGLVRRPGGAMSDKWAYIRRVVRAGIRYEVVDHSESMKLNVIFADPA